LFSASSEVSIFSLSYDIIELPISFLCFSRVSDTYDILPSLLFIAFSSDISLFDTTILPHLQRYWLSLTSLFELPIFFIEAFLS